MSLGKVLTWRAEEHNIARRVPSGSSPLPWGKCAAGRCSGRSSGTKRCFPAPAQSPRKERPGQARRHPGLPRSPRRAKGKKSSAPGAPAASPPSCCQSNPTLTQPFVVVELSSPTSCFRDPWRGYRDVTRVRSLCAARPDGKCSFFPPRRFLQ